MYSRRKVCPLCLGATSNGGELGLSYKTNKEINVKGRDKQRERQTTDDPKSRKFTEIVGGKSISLGILRKKKALFSV